MAESNFHIVNHHERDPMNKPNSEHPRDFDDPAYLWGQILATRAMLLRLAGLTTTKEDFNVQALEAIESLRNVATPRPVPEGFLDALDDAQRWVEQTTG